jgi:hypothetical protein
MAGAGLAMSPHVPIQFCMAGLDEALLSLSFPILVYMYNPCSDKNESDG